MPADETADRMTRGRLRRWSLRLSAGLGILLVLVWLAPMIVGWSPVIHWLCRRAADHLHLEGSLHISSASLGWFSPVVLHHVELCDADGRPVVQVERIESDRSLLNLLMDQEDFGSFRLEKPTLDWVFTGNTSNLEQLLARSASQAAATEAAGGQASATAAHLPQLHLEIVNGVATITDADTRQTWSAQSLGMTVLVFNDAERTVHANVQGALHDGIEAGVLKTEVHLQNFFAANSQATIKGRFSSFPLKLANLLLRRWQPNTELEGSLQGFCHLAVEFKEGRPFVDLSGEVTGNNIVLATPFLADTLTLERITAPCRLKLNHRKLTLERAEIESDLGKATLQGTFDFGEDWLAAIDQPGFDLQVDVNLPIVAERLPKTLHLQKDLRLSAGRLTVQCKSQAVRKEGIVWQGTLHTTDIRGVKDERALVWSEPLHVEFLARNLSKGVPLLEQLKCTSRFIEVEASTTEDQFLLLAEADLHQLVEPLGEFIDLEKIELAGKMRVATTIRRVSKDHFAVQGGALFKQLRLAGCTAHPWHEDAILLQWKGDGRIDDSEHLRLDRAELDAKLGDDHAQVQTLTAIPDLAAGRWGTLGVRVEGDLARWQQRSLAWSNFLADWQLAGQGKLQLQLEPGADGVTFPTAVVQASPFRCKSPNLSIDEPSLHLATSGHWHGPSQRVTLNRTNLTCPSLRANTDHLLIEPATGMISGNVRLDGDLAKLRRWMRDAATSSANAVEGELVGRIELTQEDAHCRAEFNGSLKNVLYGEKRNPYWHDPEMKFSGHGTLDAAGDKFHLDALTVLGTAIQANASGAIAKLSSRRELDLKGTLTCDLAKLEPHLRLLLGKDVKITGKSTHPFKLSGPLHPRQLGELHLTELKGEVSCQCESLHALGCDIGPANVKAVMQQGWFQLYPIETSLNGGKLRLQPNLRLEPAPREMILLAGPVIERAKLTPEMCRGLLGLALPLLANVAEADGVLSLSLEGGRIPVAAPDSSEVKGAIVLHSARFTASPIIRELSTLLKKPAPTCTIQESRVPFHMIGGKVHHRDLALTFADVQVTSSGAVGLDGSLALVLEMPMLPHLAAAAKLTAGQAKQRLRIPVGGTLDQPRIDPAALASLNAIIGRSLLENELNKFLTPK